MTPQKIAVSPTAANRITDVTSFEPWRAKDGAWKPGKNGTAIDFQSFEELCNALIDQLFERTVSTADPLAVAAADRAERTLRTKQPNADPAYVRRKAQIDAVKGGLLAFAPASFDGNVRSKGTCERVTVYVGDHDGETEESWAAAVALLESSGAAWFAYGSPKDGLAKPEQPARSVHRRLLIALSRDVTPKESARLRALVPALLELTPDASTVGDESRLYYIGHVDDVVPYCQGSPAALQAIDVDALLAANPEPSRKAAAGAGKDGRFGPARPDRHCPPGVEPIEHAKALARTSPPAVQGEGGHTTLFNLACDVVCGLLIDADEARTLLWDLYNPRCVPPWEERERKDFDRKVAEAQSCERDPGYLLSDEPSAAPFTGTPASASLTTPIFLRSRDGHTTLIWENDKRGHRPIADKIITTRIAELGHDHGLIDTRDSKGRELRPDELLKLYSATFEHTAYAFANTITTYDPSDDGKVTIGFPRVPLAPRFDADADAWLRALGGRHYDRLATWIASCSQSAINRLSACLILLGEKDIGKSLFGKAVAQLWGQRPQPMALINVQFNAGMRRCPVLVDEEAQLFGSKALSTKKLRDIVQETTRDTEGKGKERIELIGGQRLIVPCNGYSDLRFSDLGGPAVIAALRDRMLVIDALGRSAACAAALAPLRHLADDHIVDLARVAGHMAWLCETVALTGERFLGAGGDNAEGAILAGHCDEHVDLFETFRDWLEGTAEAKTWRVVPDRGLCVDMKELTLSIEAVGDGWSHKDVTNALEPFIEGKCQPHGGARLKVLDAARLADALGLDSDERANLKRRLKPSEAEAHPSNVAKRRIIGSGKFGPIGAQAKPKSA